MRTLRNRRRRFRMIFATASRQVLSRRRLSGILPSACLTPTRRPLAHLRGFAAFEGGCSLIINELDEKVFTTRADSVSVNARIPIAPYTDRFCRFFSFGPP